MGSADAAVTTPASASESAASTGAAAAANEAAWWAMLGQLRAYAREFGNADAPLGNDLGRWCAAQRRVRASDGCEGTANVPQRGHAAGAARTCEMADLRKRARA